MEQLFWLSTLAEVFSVISNNLIIPIAIIGLLFISYEKFTEAILFMLCSSVINAALKIYFQVPLSPHLNSNWYAFPSGHMQLTLAFYGILLARVDHLWKKMLLALQIIGEAWSLIYLNFHNYYDVAGAFFCSSILFAIYFQARGWFWGKISVKNRFTLLAILATVLFLISNYFYGMRTNIYFNYYSYMGFLSSVTFFKVEAHRLNLKKTLLAFIITVPIALTLWYLGKIFHNILPMPLLELRWVVIFGILNFLLFKSIAPRALTRSAAS